MALFTGVHVLTHMSWLYSKCIIAFCLPKFPMQFQWHAELFILFLSSFHHWSLAFILRSKKRHSYTTIPNFYPEHIKELKATHIYKTMRRKKGKNYSEFKEKEEKKKKLSVEPPKLERAEIPTRKT